MQVNQIEDWAQLAALCAERSIGSWIFRGVPSKEYKLVPAIGRVGARRSLEGADLPYDRAQAEILLQEFKLRARAFISMDRGADDLEWLAIGRHHGLPTAFLDWSRSPLVAAFFACQAGGIVNGHPTVAAIYAVKMPIVISRATEANDATEPVAYSPPHISPRISAQQAVMTYHPYPDTPWEPNGLLRYDIEDDTAVRIKVALHKAGLTEAALMPGLDGLAADLAWLYKREFLKEITLPLMGGEHQLKYKGAMAPDDDPAEGVNYAAARLRGISSEGS